MLSTSKDSYVRFRVSTEDKQFIMSSARRDGETMSDYFRKCVNEYELRRELKLKGKEELLCKQIVK